MNVTQKGATLKPLNPLPYQSSQLVRKLTRMLSLLQKADSGEIAKSQTFCQDATWPIRCAILCALLSFSLASIKV